jgi:acetoacetyl-CoA synthetase
VPQGTVGLPEELWAPTAAVQAQAKITRYIDWLARERGHSFATYGDLWQWSVDDVDGFWMSIWDYFDIAAATPPRRAIADMAMPATGWFEGATLNYAENLLRWADVPERADTVAVVTCSEGGPTTETSWRELADLVARAAAGLRARGVRAGDRIVAYAPNTVETVVAMLAAASLGAIWASCPPEFGVRSVLDRFAPLDPTVLVTIAGYRYGKKDIDRRVEVAEIRAGLPSLRATVQLDAASADAVPGAEGWAELVAEPASSAFVALAFDHPLYVLFSSGTTGLPKAIVHRHGGILLEHLKFAVLHHDLGPEDRFFWYTTTGWMMWNLLVSGLGAGATIVLFDGDPGHPDLGRLWRLAAETEITSFGVSAPFLMACRKAGVRPRACGDLSRLRTVGSTGAPLPADGFRWVYDELGPDVWLSSISGGTDVCSAFLGGVPLAPVVAGEMSVRARGARAEAFDPAGRPVVGQEGELVLTRPLPSMPVGFWGDADGRRYHAAYYEDYPGVWCHGDWITITDRGTCIISGRSDATLNRGGVRIGTAEVYRVVEAQPEVADSLIVHLEDPGGGLGELVLFVALTEGADLDDELVARIRAELRASLSPRHAPDAVVAVRGIPRTHSGKKLEVPVKRILTGAPLATVVSRGALADPSLLDDFERLAAERLEEPFR